SQAATLLRTYTADAGLPPTRITARQGSVPRALSAAARVAISSRTRSASALPSRMRAVMDAGAPKKGVILQQHQRLVRMPPGSKPRTLQADLIDVALVVGMAHGQLESADAHAVALHRMTAEAPRNQRAQRQRPLTRLQYQAVGHRQIVGEAIGRHGEFTEEGGVDG